MKKIIHAAETGHANLHAVGGTIGSFIRAVLWLGFRCLLCYFLFYTVFTLVSNLTTTQTNE